MPDQSANPDIGRDITVLVPAYQCASQLADHSKTLQRYRKLGCSVIWVVSTSPDGSEKIAQIICQETGDAFLLSPPGLYESWNFGIARVETEFLAISTIGDSYLNDNLVAMAELLRNLHADLVFSPPSLEGLSEKQICGFSSWPVFTFARQLEPFSGKICPVQLLIAAQVSGGLSCLLGSWASNLARTAAMKPRPFPLDFGHYGDTAWFYQQMLDLRVAFLKDPVSLFHFHPQPSSRKGNVNPKLAALHYRELPIQLYRRARPRGLWLKDCFRFYRRYYSTLYILNKTRGPHPKRFWWLHPKNWVLRLMRNWRHSQLLKWCDKWNMTPKTFDFLSRIHQ
jgi:hypothetical protein